VHMLRPAFIIADEPVSMLDAAVRVLFLNVLLDFKQKYGMTTLFITHDLSTAYYLGGEIMVISQGRIVKATMNTELPSTMTTSTPEGHTVTIKNLSKTSMTMEETK